MTTPLLLEHDPLQHWCAGCFQALVPYEAKECPRCGRRWEAEPKVVFKVTEEQVIVGGLGFLATEEVQRIEDARALESIREVLK